MKEASITKQHAIRALRDSVEVQYHIECWRCKKRLKHQFAVPPKLSTDRAFVADMAYDEGWAVGSAVYRSNGECDGDFSTFPLCPDCATPIKEQGDES
jgi:hypothetical protein